MDKRHNQKVLNYLLERKIDGATITEIVKHTGLTRDNVRIAAAALEGAGNVVSRSVGKAKLLRVTHEK